jgi:hypothetical protein
MGGVRLPAVHKAADLGCATAGMLGGADTVLWLQKPFHKQKAASAGDCAAADQHYQKVAIGIGRGWPTYGKHDDKGPNASR